MEEIWKDIEGFEGYYKVSNCGRIKTIARTVSVLTRGNTKRIHPIKEKIKSTNISKFGYPMVGLTINDKTHQRYIHRLIALAFIPKPDSHGNYVVNHKNGVKSDNRIDNLEWTTSQENNVHAIKNSLRGYKTRITLEKINEIHRLKKIGNTAKEISEKFNVSIDTIYSIIRKQSYRCLGNV